MLVLMLAFLAGLALVLAYFTHGRWLARRVFGLSDQAVCPSVAKNDGQDFVPTSKWVVFGHHFTSIAGTGPIVGPAIAVMWGWLPALLWVVFGSIFIGAVHDLGSLVVSLRHQGETVGQVAGRLLNQRVRTLFLLVLFLALTIVLAIFGLVIAAVFKQYPQTVLPCLLQIPIAVGIGVWLHRKGVALIWPSLLALLAMYGVVLCGDWGPLHAINQWCAAQPVMLWVVFLLVYSYVASVLPVWVLLQPRDFINALQLVTALGLVVAGLMVAACLGGAPVVEGGERQALAMAAPMVNWHPEGAPAVFPFLFITIACGAISGFHCLVSSGTSSKQIQKETDAQCIGYGSMLTEAFLAVLVILACGAGVALGVQGKGVDAAAGVTGGAGVLVGSEAWASIYQSWSAASGLAAKVGAFVEGASNFLKALGLPGDVAKALMGVLVASFAGTTLDTACRLQRYVVQGLAETFQSKSTAVDAGDGPSGLLADATSQQTKVKTQASPLAKLWQQVLNGLANKHGATLFAIAVGGLMAAMPAPGAAWSWANAGKGGLILWPMFGATNQLLGGLAFLVVLFYLKRHGKPFWFVLVPLVFMLVMPAWALLIQMQDWWTTHRKDGQPLNWTLLVVAVVTLCLEAWMVVEAISLWRSKRKPPMA